MDFEYDVEKSRINQNKHGVSFDEAQTVFEDPWVMTILDPLHSIEEYRFVNLGYSNKGRLLIVIFTDRYDKIRIISSRKANKDERKQYERRD
jgi:hypothetical protein